MGNEFKEIDIKNLAYYFFDDMINIKSFYPKRIKIDKKPYKKMLFITLDK